MHVIGTHISPCQYLEAKAATTSLKYAISLKKFIVTSHEIQMKHIAAQLGSEWQQKEEESDKRNTTVGRL